MVCRSYLLHACTCIFSLLFYKGMVAAECPSIWFTTAPSDEIGTPGSDVEFSCAVNADVAIVWYIPGYLPPKKNDTEYGCNTDHSECNSTLRVRNVTEDMNQMSFQCIALHGRITGDSVYSRAALLTVDLPLPTPTTVHVTTTKVVTATEVATITKVIATTKMIPVCTNTVTAGSTENASHGSGAVASTSRISAVMTVICMIVARLLLIV